MTFTDCKDGTKVTILGQYLEVKLMATVAPG